MLIKEHRDKALEMARSVMGPTSIGFKTLKAFADSCDELERCGRVLASTLHIVSGRLKLSAAERDNCHAFAKDWFELTNTTPENGALKAEDAGTGLNPRA